MAESMPISGHSARSDLVSICESEKMRRRVENWEEKIFIYGQISYKDLIEQPRRGHVPDVLVLLVHTRTKQKSGLVIAGPPQYNSHS